MKHNMEVYKPSNPALYRSIIQQHGSGHIDRYIFSQDGEGIASFFGNLFKSSVPIISRAIKGTARIVKPHAQQAIADIVKTGSKRFLDKIVDSEHQSHKKRRKKRRL